MKKVISCMAMAIANYKVVVLEKNGEYVLPKGHLEENEDYISCAIRELYEESGVIATKEDCLGKIYEFNYYSPKERAQKFIYVYLFKLDKNQPINVLKEEGFSDGKWQDINDALKILTYDNAKEALRRAIKVLNNSSK